jgi:alginate O-acetyltransferase complex protein AlgI
MVFTSHIFIYYFLPLLLLVYYNLPYRGRNLFLTVMSYLFYGWWNPWFMALMMVITMVNFQAGHIIAHRASSGRRRQMALVASVTASLSLLGFFKYAIFLTESVNQLLGPLSPQALPVLRVTLPIGISFYTFQALSYTVDVYRGTARPARSLIDFACFVSLFPQLIAGPIIRYHTVAQQLVYREHTLPRFSAGVTLFILGFAKKVILANPLGEVADTVFAAAQPAAVDAWFGVTAYALQIYFDFSAYSNMAVGLGKMLGFEFPRNFNAPYHAESITDFWRRWHISLSTFLRDYLYIPLGGNRKGSLRTYVNLAVVMLLGGLWHGASWTFLAWGALHGLLLIGERAMGKQTVYQARPHGVRVVLTFVLVLITWVFFRADTITAASHYLAAMFCLQPPRSGSLLIGAEIYTPRLLMTMGLGALLVMQPLQAFDYAQRSQRVVEAVGLLLLFVLALTLMATQSFNPFLYFQF